MVVNTVQLTPASTDCCTVYVSVALVDTVAGAVQVSAVAVTVNVAGAVGAAAAVRSTVTAAESAEVVLKPKAVSTEAT